MRKDSHIKKVKVVDEINANIGKLHTFLDTNIDSLRETLPVGYLTAIGDVRVSSKYYHEYIGSESVTGSVSLNNAMSYGGSKYYGDLLYGSSNFGCNSVGSKYCADLLPDRYNVSVLNDNQIYSNYYTNLLPDRYGVSTINDNRVSSNYYTDRLSDNLGFISLSNNSVCAGNETLGCKSKFSLTTENNVYVDSQSAIGSVSNKSNLFSSDSLKDYITCNFDIQEFLKNNTSNIFDSLDFTEFFEAKERKILVEVVFRKIVKAICKTINKIKSLLKQLAYLLKNFRVVYIRNIIRKHLKNINNSSSDEDGMNHFISNRIKYFIHYKISITYEQRKYRISY